MQKKFYIQVDEVNRVRDILDVEYEGYKEISLQVPLPYGLLGGAYKLLNDEVIYVPEWDKNKFQDELNKLKKDLEVMSKATDEMVLNAMKGDE